MYKFGIRILFQFICKIADVPTYADNVVFALSACPPLKERTTFARKYHRIASGLPKSRKTLWERGRATKRMSFRIYAEVNDVAFALKIIGARHYKV